MLFSGCGAMSESGLKILLWVREKCCSVQVSYRRIEKKALVEIFFEQSLGEKQPSVAGFVLQGRG